ncbi:MAG: LptF/LptG family permease [Treponema sp.]|nr:LptF/LptG family permease [Treponema sp.]
MENSTFFASFNLIKKKLLVSFGFAFLFVFTLLAINQILLLFNFYIKNQATFSQGISLFFYSLPSAIVMSAPYAVCIGFVHGLNKLNFTRKQAQGRKIIMPVIVLGLLISIITFIVSDFVLPNSNRNFTKLYLSISPEDGEQLETPREINSIKLLQKINEIHNDGKKLNVHILEFNKKYSIPFGALFFAFFALSLSVKIRKHLKISLCISFLSCVIYWAVLMYGQIFSLANGKYGAFVMWFPNILFLCISMILYFIQYKPPASVRAANVKGFNGA